MDAPNRGRKRWWPGGEGALGLGIGIGVALGAAIGATTGDLANGVALGLCLGAGIGTAMRSRDGEDAAVDPDEGDTGDR